MEILHSLHELLMEAIHHNPPVFVLENVLVGLIGWIVLVSIGIPGLMLAKGRGWLKFRKRDFEDRIIFLQISLRQGEDPARYVLGLRPITKQEYVEDVFGHAPDTKAYLNGVRHTTAADPVVSIASDACRGRIHTSLRTMASIRNNLMLPEQRFLIAPTFERAPGMESLHSRVMVLTPALLARIIDLHNTHRLDLEAESFEPLLDTLNVIENVYRQTDSPVFKAWLRLPTWE